MSYWLTIVTLELCVILVYKFGTDRQTLSAKLSVLIVLIVTMAFQANMLLPNSLFIMMGLILGLVGGALQLVDVRYKKAELFCLLLSTICYAVAFWSQDVLPITWWIPIFLTALSIVAILLALPYIDTQLPAILTGGLLFFIMMWGAAEHWNTLVVHAIEAAKLPGMYGFVGALLLSFVGFVWGIFYINKALRHTKHGLFTSYLLAQSLIVASALF